VLASDNVVSILQDSADRPDSGQVSSPEQSSSPPLPSSKVRVACLTVVPPRAEVCVEVLCAAPVASVSSRPSLEEIALAYIWPMALPIFYPTSHFKSNSSIPQS
jgi:hypothetical protein